MANALYPNAKQLCLGTGLNLTAAVVKAQLIDTALYTYSSAHQNLSDVSAGSRVGSPVTLASKTISNGVFDAADLSFTGLTSAPTIEALILYIDTGTESTSTLIAYIDTATGLPTAANQTQGSVTWDNGANKIFAL